MRHQLFLRIIRTADDANHFLNINEDNETAFQCVDTSFGFIQGSLGTGTHGTQSETDPFRQNVFQAFLARLAVNSNHHKIELAGSF